MPILVGFGIYLGLGIIALGILDIFTKRVRTKLVAASEETQGKMLNAGQMVGRKTAMALTAGALWLFWVVAIFAALRKAKEDEPSGEKR